MRHLTEMAPKTCGHCCVVKIHQYVSYMVVMTWDFGGVRCGAAAGLCRINSQGLVELALGRYLESGLCSELLICLSRIIL